MTRCREKQRVTSGLLTEGDAAIPASETKKRRPGRFLPFRPDFH
jgi:hypothetical protein